jgi:hypothetical protein
MPTYTYEYETPDGPRRVERRFKMSEYPQEIEVEETDGTAYTAHLIMSLISRGDWGRYEIATSDLPPIDHPPID